MMNLLLVLFLAACSGTSDADHAEGPAKAERAKGKKARPPQPKGELVHVNGTLDFLDEGGAVLKPCAGGEPLQLRPGSGDPSRIRQELGESVDDVYVEMRGLKQEDGSVVIKAFDVAMVGYAGCTTPLAVTLTASGNDPAWKADVKDDTLVVTLEDGKAVTVSGIKKTDVKMPITYEGNADGVGLVRLAVKRERCKDLKQSAFFPWAATLDAGGKTYKGCARGDLPKVARVTVTPAPGAPAAEGEAPAEE